MLRKEAVANLVMFTYASVAGMVSTMSHCMQKAAEFDGSCGKGQTATPTALPAPSF
jgi:hypothetical protein